jgi:hypothetical protein
VRLAVAAAIALAALAGCGGADDSGSDATTPDIFRAVPQDTIVAPADKAAPRWEPVATVTGTGVTTRTFSIDKDAIQWRVRWRCSTGRLAVAVRPLPRSGPAGNDGACPGSGRQSWVTSGTQHLGVKASGRWRMTIEQEVDSPLDEPPTAAMRSSRATVIARGDFYEIERKGRGSATLYRLASGRLALRMEDFATDSNTDLFVWLSEARRPATTRAAFAAPHDEVAVLKSTLGDQNYLLPKSADASRIRSVVIWCQPVQIAYAAATLRRP